MKPLVIARCGDSECFPENTFAAFESAIRKGADGIELDVHLTTDNELIVHHFFNLGSSDNGLGLVGEHTLADLKSLDAGSWFSPEFAGLQKPTLAEVLELCKGKVRLEIELKDSSLNALSRVIREIEEFALSDDVEITTAHYPLLVEVKKLNPHLSTGTFFLPPPDWMPLRLAQQQIIDWSSQLDIQVVHLDLALITPEFVGKLKQNNFIVYGSNLDTVMDMQKAFDLGIDVFSTGHLSTALQVRDDRLKANQPTQEKA
jgi:glycerophosphoryl diester phosphodiesterase